tara:strand:+ start:5163 stop:6095 length:933 start_codon:yes stop_codon:yes gene_type:complete
LKELLLHVGQDKTGSSFIQSTLANSIEVLKQANICYPINKKVMQASKGKISSGNAGLLLNLADVVKLDNSDKYLFSSEKLFRTLFDDAHMNAIQNLKEALGITKIKVLLYIREPLEHFSSAYQQAIKRGGYTESVQEFVKLYAHTKKVCDFVTKCNNTPDVDLTVINYSDQKHKLINTLEKWLAIESGKLIEPTMKRVNRSLSLGELEFQRVANEFFGKKASILADRLCETLPEIAAQQVVITEESQQLVLDKVKPYCDSINIVLQNIGQESSQYKCLKPKPQYEDNSYNFEKSQITLIADVFSKLRNEK